MGKIIIVYVSTLFMASCSLLPPDSQDIDAKMQKIEQYEGQTQEAIFSGGCFWCIEASFEYVNGVVTAVSGYAGGQTPNPAYEEVSSGATDHIESVLVIYDPEIISYRELVDYFWKQFDPTDAGGSFGDRGHQYTSAIFYMNEQQKKIAEESRKALEESGVFDEPIVTDIRPATPFYPAESYHQDYYKENPLRYRYYRGGSGRDQFLQEVWGEDTVHGLESE